MNQTRIALLRGREPLSSASVGDRVELHPATDAWMMGDRFGRVEKIMGRSGRLNVRMDRSGKLRTIHPSNIGRVL